MIMMIMSVTDFFKVLILMSSSGKYDMSFSRQKVIFAKYTDLEMV